MKTKTLLFTILFWTSGAFAQKPVQDTIETVVDFRLNTAGLTDTLISSGYGFVSGNKDKKFILSEFPMFSWNEKLSKKIILFCYEKEVPSQFVLKQMSGFNCRPASLRELVFLCLSNPDLLNEHYAMVSLGVNWSVATFLYEDSVIGDREKYYDMLDELGNALVLRNEFLADSIGRLLARLMTVKKFRMCQIVPTDQPSSTSINKSWPINCCFIAVSDEMKVDTLSLLEDPLALATDKKLNGFANELKKPAGIFLTCDFSGLTDTLRVNGLGLKNKAKLAPASALFFVPEDSGKPVLTRAPGKLSDKYFAVREGHKVSLMERTKYIPDCRVIYYRPKKK